MKNNIEKNSIYIYPAQKNAIKMHIKLSSDSIKLDHGYFIGNEESANRTYATLSFNTL